MAVYITSADEGLSASTWYRSEEYQLPLEILGVWEDALATTVATQVLSFANNCNLHGVVLLMWFNGNTRPVKVTLQENTGSWVDRVSVELSYTEMLSYADAPLCYYCWVPFVFASPYAVTTAANTWRLQVEKGSGGTGNPYVEYKDSGKTQMVRACITDAATGVPGASDAAMVMHTITMDQSWALGPLEQDSGSTWALFLANGGVLQLEDPPAASYTLTLTGMWQIGGDAQFLVGTEIAPVPASEQFNLVFDGPGAGKMYGTDPAYVSYRRYRLGELRFYGESPDIIWTKLAAAASSGQPVIELEDDVSADWQAGDTVYVCGAYYADSEAATILSVVGTTVTLTGNLSKSYYAGMPVYLTTDTCYGVKVTATAGGTFRYSWYDRSALVLSGVYYNTSATQGQMTLYDGGLREDTRLDHCFFDGHSLSCGQAIKTFAHYLTHVVFDRHNAYSVLGSFSNLWACVFEDVLFVRSSYSATRANVSFAGCNDLVLDNVLHAAMRNTTAQYAFGFSTTTRLTATNLAAWCMGNYGVVLGSLNGSTIDGLMINGALVAGLRMTNCVKVEIAGINLSPESGTDVLMDFVEGYSTDVLIRAPDGVVSVDTTELTNMLPGTLVGIHDFSGDGGDDHRNYLPAGIIRSSGTGLTDTTCHTGGFAVRFEPLSDSDNLEWSFTIPTGDLTDLTMFIGVWCKINNAAYYGGTHQLPRLTVDYDDGTTAYAEAAESTDWQLLTVPFTPTTDFPRITVTLSGRTDATGSDAYVYWDDFSIAFPPNTTLDLGSMDLWASAMPVTPPIAIPISVGTLASAVWEVLRSEHTTAGSFGAVDEWAGAIDEATIRSAVGLAAANLDTQLAALQTDLDNPSQYKADVSALATAAGLTATEAAVLLAIAGISSITADDVLDEPVEDEGGAHELTLREIQRILLAFAAGKASGGGTTAIAFRDQADSKDRIAGTVDAQGNRTAVTVDGS